MANPKIWGVGGGLANIVEDLTPQLGGNLDLNNHNISGVGNIAGATYGSDGSISDAELLTLDDGATTQILVGGGAGSAPVWTAATGSGAPVRATSPTLVTPVIGAATGTSLSVTSNLVAGSAVPRVTIGGGTNDNGITFGSLGTATKGIDLSSSGLSGADILLDGPSGTYYILANGTINQALYLIAGGTGSITSDTAGWSVNYSSTRNHVFSLAAGPLLLGNKTPVGSLTACTSNGTTTITKTGHGLSVAAGDLVHITGATTAADKGFYTLASSTADTLVVDRTLSGSDADVALTVYKDVIGFFATNGTNGQRIMNYSHQNKPLQLGGHVLATTTAGLTSEDVLISGDRFEVDGMAYFEGGGHFTAAAYMDNDVQLRFGTAGIANLLWETADANANELILTLPNGGAINVPIFVIGDQGILNANLGWFHGQTIPRIAMVAADEGGYFSFGVDNSDILDILATTAPVVEVDESKMSHKLQCVINSVTYYIMLTTT